MEIEKAEKYTDLYLTGLDVEGYPAQHEVNVCTVCYAVVSVGWDHWEKHQQWHKENDIHHLRPRKDQDGATSQAQTTD